MCLLTDASKGINENFQKYKFEGPRSHPFFNIWMGKDAIGIKTKDL